MGKDIFDTLNALLFMVEIYNQEPHIDENGMITAVVIDPENINISMSAIDETNVETDA